MNEKKNIRLDYLYNEKWHDMLLQTAGRMVHTWKEIKRNGKIILQKTNKANDTYSFVFSYYVIKSVINIIIFEWKRHFYRYLVTW